MKYVMSSVDVAKLSKDFTYHIPKDDQPQRYEEIRAKGKEMAELIMVDCPVSRETSIVLSRLEEAVMWANAAIARNE